VLYEKNTHRIPNMEVPIRIWTSRTNGQAVDRLVMQTDGNLVMYPPDDPNPVTGPNSSCPLLPSCRGPQAIWQTHTKGHKLSTLRVDDGGTIGIYDQSSSLIWSKP